MTNIKTLDPTYRLRKGDVVALRGVVALNDGNRLYVEVDGMPGWQLVDDPTKLAGLFSYTIKVGDRVIVDEDAEYPAIVRAIIDDHAALEWFKVFGGARFSVVPLTKLAPDLPPEIEEAPPIEPAPARETIELVEAERPE